MSFGKSIFYFVFCLCAFSETYDLLTIQETIEMSQVSSIKHFIPDAWRGNPAARDTIYKLIRGDLWKNRTCMLSYIGLIGDESDVATLLSFIPTAKDEMVDYDVYTASGVFVSLAYLSNRGFSEAGNVLANMTKPEYWKTRNVGYKHHRNPFQAVAREAVFTYPFAGRDDFEQILEGFLNSIPDARERTAAESDLRYRYESVVKREKEMGTWKVRGCPKLKPLPEIEEQKQRAAEKENEERQAKIKWTKDAISAVLAGENNFSPADIPRHGDNIVASEIQERVNKKQWDDNTYKEIIALGLFPEVAEVKSIMEYMDSLPKQLDAENRKVLAASIYTLGLLAYQGSIEAQRELNSMKYPQHWRRFNKDIYEGTNPCLECLQSDNVLALASFVTYALPFAVSMTSEQINDYLNHFELNGVEREIIEKWLSSDVRQYVENHNPNKQGEDVIDKIFKNKIFDIVLRIITPPVTKDSILAPTPQ